MKSFRILTCIFLALFFARTLSAAHVYKSRKRNIHTFFHQKSRYPAYYWMTLQRAGSYLSAHFPVRPDVGWVKILDNHAHPLRQVYSEVLSAKKYIGSMKGKEITSLFKTGKKYSYVILDDQVVFALIQPKPRHRYSKHIVASGFSPQVRYAGEAWLQAGDHHLLIIDNNSGTYKPDYQDINQARLLLQDQLGIRVNVRGYR